MLLEGAWPPPEMSHDGSPLELPGVTDAEYQTDAAPCIADPMDAQRFTLYILITSPPSQPVCVMTPGPRLLGLKVWP